MTPRYTWLWVTLAASLLAFIVLVERHWRPPEPGAQLVLGGFSAGDVTSVQVRPAGQLEIRVERSNGVWQIVRPLQYPADGGRVEGLLRALEQLQAQAFITGAELRQVTNADAAFGFDMPQVSLSLQSAAWRRQVLLGARTAPGDQVYVQVVGAEGVYVVGAELLEHLPRSADDWRQTVLVPAGEPAFDRIRVTNSNGAFELRRDGGQARWRLVEPLQARADPARVTAALEALQRLRVARFVTDDPAADLEAYGLQPPALALWLGLGTNPVLQLHFGQSLTNEAEQVFARRLDVPGVVAVGAGPLAPWRAAHGEFRDRHLLSLDKPPDTIEVLGPEVFTVQRFGRDWRLLPLDLPADADSVEALVANLTNLTVTEFVKDVVIEPDLARYGLAVPAREFVLRALAAQRGQTNLLLGHVQFGATVEDKTYARRPDETSVYAVKSADFGRLPVAAFQLRDRRIWNVELARVARVTIQEGGRQRQLVRLGAHSWTLAPGSSGLINPLAVEEAVEQLAGLYALQWVAVGDAQLSRFGFEPGSWRITLELNSGDRLSVQFGGAAPSQLTYAATELEGQVWIFECPPAISELARVALALPADSP